MGLSCSMLRMSNNSEESSKEDETEVLLVTSNLRSDDHFVEHIGDKPVKEKYRLAIITLSVICVILMVVIVTVVIRCWPRISTGGSSTRDFDTDKFKLFFHVSDTHLDLFYNTNITNSRQHCRNVSRLDHTSIKKADNEALFGRTGCDSPSQLLQSAADEMKKLSLGTQRSAEFVLLTGDQSAHSYSSFQLNLKESVYWSIGNSTKTISETVGLPIVPVIGNNDLFNDYVPPITPSDPFYVDLRNILEPYIFPDGGSVQIISDFRKSFDVGGYYTYNTLGGKIVLILLNTNYWSERGYSENRNITILGDIQMEWLNATLYTAKLNHKKVVLAGHIPPGCSTYPGEKNYWKSNYTELYVQMTTETFADIVAAHLYGHTHQDKIQLLSLSDVVVAPSAFVLLCPSITPNFQNNPAFRLVEYDKELHRLNDYTQYFMDLTAANVNGLPVWQKEYSFQKMYNTIFDFTGMNSLVETLRQVSSPFWYDYRRYMKTDSGAILNSKRFVEYCAAKFVSLSEFEACLHKYKNVGT